MKNRFMIALMLGLMFALFAFMFALIFTLVIASYLCACARVASEESVSRYVN
jgi:hypothetical protein